MKLETAGTSATMVEAMKGVTGVMSKVNEDMNVSNIRDTLKEFAKESEKLDMQGEMMSDAIDAGMDSVDDEAEADKVYTQICDEIGVEMNADQTVARSQLGQAAPGASMNDLEARLGALKSDK